MHSKRQLAALKNKKRKKNTPLASKGPSANSKFKLVVPTLIETGVLPGGYNGNINMLDGGPYAAVKILNALGYTIIDKPKDYSFYQDTNTTTNKNIFNNKNIVTIDLKNLENEKISVSKYYLDSTDSIFVADTENRLPNERIKYRSMKDSDPNNNIKIDLTAFAMDMCAICAPNQNAGLIFDPDFHKSYKEPEKLLVLEPNRRNY
jgi:hypothetical protein